MPSVLRAQDGAVEFTVPYMEQLVEICLLLIDLSLLYYSLLSLHHKLRIRPKPWKRVVLFPY